MMLLARAIAVQSLIAMLSISLGKTALAPTTEPSLPMSPTHQAIVDSAVIAIWSEHYRDELVVDYEASDSTRVVYRMPGRPFELVIVVTDAIPPAYYCQSCLVVSMVGSNTVA